MMGYQHALGGAAAWLAVAPAVDAAVGLTPAQTALGVVLAAGGGMVPDLDQRGSTIGRTYGPITNVLARIVGWLAGGHRNGTHSIPGLLVLAAITWATAVGMHAPYLVTWIVLGVGFRGLRMKGRHRAWSRVSLMVGCGIVTVGLASASLDVLPPLLVAVPVGAVSHVLLDMLTPERCPLFWPFSKHRYGVGLVTTDSPRSSPIVTALLVVVLGVLVVTT